MPRGNRQRRETRWVDQLLNISIASGASTVASLTGELGPDALSGMTLIRSIFCYTVSPAAHTLVSGSMGIDIGLGMTQDEALAAAALPDVDTQSDYPNRGWIYRCRHIVYDSINGEGGPGNVPMTQRADVRSQRKMGQDEDIFLALVNTSLEGTGFNVRFHGIILMLYLI